MKNYYNLLGIKQTATAEQIKNAYLEKMKKYHPDIFVGDKNFAMQKTKELNEAYNTLKDNEKRKEYNAKITNNNKENIILKIFKTIGRFFKNIFNKVCGFFSYKNCENSLKKEELQGFYKNYFKFKIIIVIEFLIIFILLLILVF